MLKDNDIEDVFQNFEEYVRYAGMDAKAKITCGMLIRATLKKNQPIRGGLVGNAVLKTDV
jgi:hypothetical protein